MMRMRMIFNGKKRKMRMNIFKQSLNMPEISKNLQVLMTSLSDQVTIKNKSIGKNLRKIILPLNNPSIAIHQVIP